MGDGPHSLASQPMVAAYREGLLEQIGQGSSLCYQDSSPRTGGVISWELLAVWMLRIGEMLLNISKSQSFLRHLSVKIGLSANSEEAALFEMSSLFADQGFRESPRLHCTERCVCVGGEFGVTRMYASVLYI